ncbi:MAG: S41 family peptidase [Pseudomonadota bacterium]
MPKADMLQRFLMALVLGVSFGITLVVGLSLSRETPKDVPALPDNDLLAEVIAEVEREYVDPVDESALLEAAARGLVADLDSHSQFLDDQQYADLRVSASGNYSGVGLEVTLRDGEVIVITAYPESPASRADIRTGDILIAIDDWPIDSQDLYATVSRLRGTAESDVSLSFLRDGSDEPLQHRLTREPMAIPSVEHKLLAPGVGVLHISQFHERTARQVIDAIAALNRDNLTPLDGLVIDLRDNPGGILDSAIDTADLFLDSGIIVSARGRTESAHFEHRASPGSMLPEARLIVLINGASASAAEVLAAALRDNDRARLLGTSSFGKGLVQTVVPLRDGGAIKLTTSRYYTPDGDYIDNRGLTPDIVVRKTPTADTDPQMEAAVSALTPQRLKLSER